MGNRLWQHLGFGVVGKSCGSIWGSGWWAKVVAVSWGLRRWVRDNEAESFDFWFDHHAHVGKNRFLLI